VEECKTSWQVAWAGGGSLGKGGTRVEGSREEETDSERKGILKDSDP